MNPGTKGVGLQSERRRWPRLPLAIPVFVRCLDDQGKELVEFATALNVSAGGMLVAVRRMQPALGKLTLEVPSSPMAASAPLPGTPRMLHAKTVRTIPSDGCYLLAVKFSRPLGDGSAVRRKKVLSAV